MRGVSRRPFRRHTITLGKHGSAQKDDRARWAAVLSGEGDAAEDGFTWQSDFDAPGPRGLEANIF